MIRSVITVITGIPGAARSRARTAGSVVKAWKATITAGRVAATARATLRLAGASSVWRAQPRVRGEPQLRHSRPHSQGVSRMHGPYRLTSQRSRSGEPGPRSGSQMTGANRPG